MLQQKRKYLLVIKYGIILASLCAIAFKVYNELDLTGKSVMLWFGFERLVSYLLPVLLLMAINWLLEAYKWKLLMQPLEPISVKTSVKAVLSGIVTGTFTPNRIGEFAGRILYLKPENRISGTAFTWVGNFCQFLVTVVMGLLGIGFLIQKGHTPQFGHINLNRVWIITGLTVLLWLAGWAIYRYLMARRLKERLHTQFLKLKTVLTDYSPSILIKALALSFLRFTIFSVQFYLIVHYFLPESNPLMVISGLWTVYLCALVMPIWPLADPVVRGSLAVVVFASFMPNTLVVVFSVFMLWAINVTIPALGGYYIIMKDKPVL